MTAIQAPGGVGTIPGGTATDDQRIDSQINELIVDAGFEPLRVGGLDQSIRLEVFGDLHEFGALGKPVSLSEAKEKL